MRSKKPTTVNQYLARKLGLKRALYVETFIMLWAMYGAANNGDDPPNIETLAAEIGKSTAQVYRWRSDFHEAFPNYATPRELLDAMAVARDKALTMRQLGGLAVVL